MRHTIIIFILFFSCQLSAEEIKTNSQIDYLFNNAGVQGTLVVYYVNSNQYIAHAPNRAKKRFVPASTFKIANSLIGLSVGAVKNVDEILPYGGKPQSLKIWERDMGLRSAIKISNVPIYKELARRIGIDRMQKHIVQLNYGNRQIGSIVDSFWLVGPLAISAIEQTQFLAKLAQGNLAYSKKVQVSVHEIIMLEKGQGFTLYGKTGWSQGIGWWVGWVEKENLLYTFAINIDMIKIEDAPKRIEIGKGGLRMLGILK